MTNIFKLNLFKFLKQILDGDLPIFYDLLMARYVTPHDYRTRRMGIGFRCPNVTCVRLLEELPDGLMDLGLNLATRHFKRALLDGQ